MAKGGARNRSGPQADPTSLRSAARGVVLTALPSEGYRGQIPDFPLPQIARFYDEWEDGKKRRVFDQGLTEAFRERELEVWAEAWRTPQACAWAGEAWRWPTVAEFCRLKVIVEQEPELIAIGRPVRVWTDDLVEGYVLVSKDSQWSWYVSDDVPREQLRAVRAAVAAVIDRYGSIGPW